MTANRFFISFLSLESGEVNPKLLATSASFQRLSPGGQKLEADQPMARLLPTAYEVHDFQPIPIFQSRSRPLLLVDNLPVQLDRDPVRLHSEFLNQSTQRLRREPAFIAVDD